jgi:hypothetical protein
MEQAELIGHAMFTVVQAASGLSRVQSIEEGRLGVD